MNTKFASTILSLLAIVILFTGLVDVMAAHSAAGDASPPAPTSISASDGTYLDKVRVSWESAAVGDFQAYLPLILSSGGGDSFNDRAADLYFKVYRNTSDTHAGETELADNHTASPYDDTSAVAGTTYTYWVKACNASGCSEYSSADTGYREVEVTIPSPPDWFSASKGTYIDKVRLTWLTWTATSSTTYFKVYRNTGDTHVGETELVDNHPASPYDDASTPVGTVYTYWVKECNSAGCSDYSASDTGWKSASISLKNGDFEAGSDGSWTEYSFNDRTLIWHQLSTFPFSAHSGEWLAWLGGENRETSTLEQVVTIPINQPYLHFWYIIDSNDFFRADEAYVTINATVVETFELYIDNNTSDWTAGVVDLSAYAGNNVKLGFEVHTDSFYFSSFFLDDVAFSASATPAVVDLNAGSLMGDLPPRRR